MAVRSGYQRKQRPAYTALIGLKQKEVTNKDGEKVTILEGSTSGQGKSIKVRITHSNKEGVDKWADVAVFYQSGGNSYSHGGSY